MRNYKRGQNKQRKKYHFSVKKTILNFQVAQFLAENTWNHYGQMSTMKQSNRMFGMKWSCLSSQLKHSIKTKS